MKKISALVAVLAVVALSGCVTATTKNTTNLKENPDIQKVAVVSMAISDWSGSVQSGSVGNDSVHALMQGATGEMLAFTEEELGRNWQVRKVESFIDNKQYRQAADDLKVDVYSPEINGTTMPLLGPGFKRGDITPEKAGELCAALEVDAVVLVFSEWATATGNFVPTTKSLAKNVVSLWDSQGEKIYFRRIDLTGSKTLGGGNVKAVNDETISEWTGAYQQALETMMAEM